MKGLGFEIDQACIDSCCRLAFAAVDPLQAKHDRFACGLKDGV